jgi:hypothetical protein
MSLKDFGWETYRVRSHSIPPSLANTDTYHSSERLISRASTSNSSPHRNASLQVTPPASMSSITRDSSDNTTKHDLNEPITVDMIPSLRLNLHQDSISTDTKSIRSSTMSSTVSFNANEKIDVPHGK